MLISLTGCGIPSAFKMYMYYGMIFDFGKGNFRNLCHFVGKSFRRPRLLVWGRLMDYYDSRMECRRAVARVRI